MGSVSIFGGSPSEFQGASKQIVFREQFTGDGSTKTFTLNTTNPPGNVSSWTNGSWAVGQVLNTYPAHVTGTDKKPTYDSTNPITRNRIGVSSINGGTGVVTLDYAPRNGVDFYIWYWYELRTSDLIEYYREEFVASVEDGIQGLASSINVDTTNFDGILSGSDSTVQAALDTMDDHLHDGQTLQCDGIQSDVTELVINEAGNDVDFRVEASGVANALFVQGSDGAVSMEGPSLSIGSSGQAKLTANDSYGLLTLGKNDSVDGQLYLYGDSGSTGAKIRLYKGANDDATVDYFSLQSDGNTFMIGTPADTDAFKITDDKDLYLTDGDLYIQSGGSTFFSTYSSGGVGYAELGDPDTSRGYLFIRGHGAGTSIGGTLQLDVSADYDTTINYYTIYAFQDDLRIGPDIDADALKLDSNKDLYITDGDLYVQNGGTSTFHLNSTNYTLYIGVSNTNRGAVFLYGAATDAGGEAHFYLPDNYNSTIASYIVQVDYNYLTLGPNTDTDALKLDSNKDLYITDGDLYVQSSGTNIVKAVYSTFAYLHVGSDDSIGGLLYLYGHAAGSSWGGGTTMYLAADYDSVISNYSVSVYEDDLLIGPNTDTDALKLDSNKDLYLTDGDLYVQSSSSNAFFYLGNDDSVRGLVVAYGGDTGVLSGGTVRLNLSADYDTTISYYNIMAYQSDLRIGPDTDTDALKLDSNSDFFITAGSLIISGASEYINFGAATQGSTGYGIRDNAGTMEYKDSGGSWTTFASLSDISLKRNIRDYDLGLNFINQLSTRAFEFKKSPEKTEHGLIAQEVEKVINSIGIDFSGWYERPDGLQGLNYDRFVIPLINAVKELSARVYELEQEVMKNEV